MKVSKSFSELVAAAEQLVVSLSPTEVEQRMDNGATLIDLRDIRELQREGKIPGAMHVPRGMLEFWIDPSSPYYNKRFDEATELVLYCNKGWRSALAAKSLLDMGVDAVAHIEGGMERWQLEGKTVEPLPERK